MNKKIAIDFDNTIISYDNLFFECAFRKGLIPFELNKTKLEIRNSIRRNYGEKHWQILQKEIYGKEIVNAPAFDDALDVIKKCIDKLNT